MRQRIVDEMTAEMLSKGFDANKFVTLLGEPNRSKEDIRDCFLHTLRVLQRKAYGRYNKTPIKHLSVCESNGKTNPHIHSLIQFDTDAFTIDEWMLLLKRTWGKTKNGKSMSLSEDKQIANETWFKDVYDTAGAVDYCFKKSNGNGDDYLFVDRCF
jgi:hypothetical protein